MVCKIISVAIASVETAPSTALNVPPVVTPAVVAVRRVTISDDNRPATAQQGHTVRLRQASLNPRRPKSAPLTALRKRELVVQKPIDPIDPADTGTNSLAPWWTSCSINSVRASRSKRR